MIKPYKCCKCGAIYDYKEHANFICKDCVEKNEKARREKSEKEFAFVDEWLANLDKWVSKQN